MRNKIIEKLWLIFFDTLGVLLAFTLAYFLRLGTFFHGEFPFEPYFVMGIATTPFWIFLLIVSGRYEIREKNFWAEIRIILFSSLSASLLFPLVFYFTNERFFSRGIIILLFFLGAGILILHTFIRRKILEYKISKNTGFFRMMVIGSDRNSRRIIAELLEKKSYHRPVAILSPYGAKEKQISGVKIFGKLDALERVFEQEDIDEIFLCDGIEHSENLASFCRNKGVPLKTSLETMGIFHHKILAESIGNTTFLTLHQSELFGWGQFFKRIFDIVFASVGLLIFSPYILWNWKNIQKISYQNGIDSHFSGYKITPTSSSCNSVESKCSESSALQVIPLLLSVLEKKASIVGPKIFPSDEYYEKFSGKKEQTAMRFILRPGIFSPWDTKKSPLENFREEVLYIRNWSFWKDIVLIIKCSI